MKKSPVFKTEDQKMKLFWDKKGADLEKEFETNLTMSLIEYFEFLESFAPTDEELLDVKIFKERFHL
ncbi:MAG: hypothetical protein H6696_17405 [Deferribacteres bacterium]|nr:hypothetical protein [candidate division KSB1 bacterium]MCB9503714.1 hypothetical protein [Deferribacteres bacterium]